MKKTLQVVNYVLASYIVFWVISPIVRENDLLKMGVLISVVLWLITATILLKSSLLKGGVNVLIIYAVLAYVFIASVLTGGMALFASQTNLFILVFLVLFYYFYRQQNSKLAIYLLIFTIALIVIHAAITAYYNINYPDFSRRLVDSRITALQERILYSKKGVGTYGIVYAAALLAPVLMLFLYKNHWARPLLKRSNITVALKPIKKATSIGLQVVLVIAIILLSVLVLVCNFSYALVALSIGFVMALLYMMRKKPLLIIVLALLVAGIVAFLVLLLDRIEISTDYSNYLSKLSAVVESIRLGKPVAQFDNRVIYYQESWHMIARYPLGGVLYVPSEIGGGHALLFDVLAVYGIGVGAIILYAVLHVPFSIALNKKRSVWYYGLMVVVGLMLIFSVTAGIYTLGIVAYMILGIIESNTLQKIESWYKEELR